MFGDTGYVLYQSERIPDDFNWILLAIESDLDVREMGQDISAMLDDQRLKVWSYVQLSTFQFLTLFKPVPQFLFVRTFLKPGNTPENQGQNDV